MPNGGNALNQYFHFQMRKMQAKSHTLPWHTAAGVGFPGYAVEQELPRTLKEGGRRIIVAEWCGEINDRVSL